MFTEIKKLIRYDRKLQWILFLGLVIQFITCIKAIGFSNFDQHFSVVEFSSYQLGNENAAHYAFELESKIRPTLQVYMFSAYYKVCMFFHLEDPYMQLTVLRVILGLFMFGIFNLIAFHYFKKDKPRILYAVLLILNFSWIFPYTRTLYSSEMMSGLFFFSTIALYDAKREKNPSNLFLFGVGFLLCLSFYFRFQIGFAIAGFGLWLLFVEKKYKRLLPLAAGFLIAFLLNSFLDYRFYGEWVLSPVRYFETNILQGKAAEYGTSSFLKYIGLLVAVITAPPFSVILFYYSIKTFFKKYSHPVFITVLLFIIGHSIIGHKEERFLYPVFSALPLIIGWSLPGLINFYASCKKWIAGLIKAALILTLIVNTVLLLLFTFIPYAQTVDFGRSLKMKFRDEAVTIYCLYRTPFETMSGVPMVFYRKGVKNMEFIKISTPDSLRYLTNKDTYIATTFNEIKPAMTMLDSLGYKPVAWSSKILWNINRFLLSKKKSTVNDAWVLYKKE
ncbi:MAG: hypothetical protein IPI68_06385 [Chitinophagaceae bacterium]|nr:hypothetical protein [Chitinophagaceae bacterium]